MRWSLVRRSLSGCVRSRNIKEIRRCRPYFGCCFTEMITLWYLVLLKRRMSRGKRRDAVDLRKIFWCFHCHIFLGLSVIVLGTGFDGGTSYVSSGLHCLTSQMMFRNYSCWLNMNSVILMRIQNWILVLNEQTIFLLSCTDRQQCVSRICLTLHRYVSRSWQKTPHCPNQLCHNLHFHRCKNFCFLLQPTELHSHFYYFPMAY